MKIRYICNIGKLLPLKYVVKVVKLLIEVDIHDRKKMFDKKIFKYRKNFCAE